MGACFPKPTHLGAQLPDPRAMPAMLSRKDPLPDPSHRGMGVLAPQGVGKVHLAIAIGVIPAKQALQRLPVGLRLLCTTRRQDRPP
jgi:hypothetical protein